MSWFSTLFGGGVVTAAEGIANVVDKFVETEEEKKAAELIRTKLLMQPAIAQVELNKIEAGHRSVFVAGWRPCIGWVAGISLAAYFIPQFLLGAWLWVDMVITKGELVPYPVDPDGLMELVIALLGLSGFRSAEKLMGKSK